MLIFHGKRTVRVKKYTNNNLQCPGCRSFDLGIKVYKEYFHLFFIPAFPTGKKYADIRCQSCGQPVRTESLHKEYLDKTRSPFYLYTLIILFASVFVFALAGNLVTQQQKKKYIADPHAGDIYTIRSNTGNVTTYYFLRLNRVNGDTVYTSPGALGYFSYVSQPAANDSFISMETRYTKKQLQQMLSSGEINAVKRK